MRSLRTFCVAALACVALSDTSIGAEKLLPAKDERGGTPHTLNTLREFPRVSSLPAWQHRARAIREQVLVSCGLWPMPERTPLNAKVFGRVERDGYSVEKVYFESYPGFYVAGNLYRPLGKGSGPFPGILNPHGHWVKGRLEDGKDGSTAARCINFARQGMIALTWDMVGYNDTQFGSPAGEPGYKTHRNFANHLTNQLWNISQMGLQTWNSVRALDFLCSLPDVDTNRLACTGESGGGTQTFMLGAIDDRLAAQAPIVMVSHSMQGGCSCENVAGLRVDYSNMEIAACPAPRPQIMVGATGDWTRAIMTVEGPALESVYRLFGAKEHLRYVRYDFNHNYNQTTREAVYGWFSKCLLKRETGDPLEEISYTKEPDADLRVFGGNQPRPANAVTEEQLTAYLIQQATNELWTFKPVNPPLLERYRKQMISAWKRNLQVELVDKDLVVAPGSITKLPDCAISTAAIGRAGKGDRLPVLLITPRQGARGTVAVLVHPDGKAAYLDEQGMPKNLAKELIAKEVSVLLLDTFGTGDLSPRDAKPRKYDAEFFTTYNRTDVQERVQDLVTASAFARAHGGARQVILCGSGRAGLWTLLAAPAAQGVVADCVQLDSSSDAELLAPDLFSPGLRKMGGFEGVAAINVGNPLFLHNTGERFSTSFLKTVYNGMRAWTRMREEKELVGDEAIARWIAEARAL